jgi:hypothetical protein
MIILLLRIAALTQAYRSLTGQSTSWQEIVCDGPHQLILEKDSIILQCVAAPAEFGGDDFEMVNSCASVGSKVNSGFSSKGGHEEEHEILVLDITSHTGRGYGELSSSKCLKCDAKDGPRSGTSPRQQSIVAKYIMMHAENYRSIAVRSSSPRFVMPIRMSACRIPVWLHIH